MPPSAFSGSQPSLAIPQSASGASIQNSNVPHQAAPIAMQARLSSAQSARVTSGGSMASGSGAGTKGQKASGSGLQIGPRIIFVIALILIMLLIIMVVLIINQTQHAHTGMNISSFVLAHLSSHLALPFV